MNSVTKQPEVVECPDWVEAGMFNVQITKPDCQVAIPETSYLLSREESDRIIGSLTGNNWWWNIPGQWSSFHAYRESLDQRYTPISEKVWDAHASEDGYAGLWRCSSSCRWCPDPFQDVPRGYQNYLDRFVEIETLKTQGVSSLSPLVMKLQQSYFPKRCRPCRALYSSRRRGRKAAQKLELLRFCYDWKFTHWIHTERVRTKSDPWTKEEIMEDKRRMMKKLSRLYESKKWYSAFTGIQVYEAKVRAPGDVVTGKRKDGSEYRREVKTFELHGHIHACIIHPKDGYVDVKSIRESHFEGSIYKDKYEVRKLGNGNVATNQKIGKIIGDYLVGYCRKDIIGNMGWCGPRRYRHQGEKVWDDDHHMRSLNEI